MKSFKKFVAEVAQPEPEEEKRFKDQHTIEVTPHPVAPDHVFTGEIPGVTKKARPADNTPDAAIADYDKAYDDAEDRLASVAESVEDTLSEISKALAGRYLKKVPASAADAGDKIGRSSANQAGASADVRKGYEKDRKKGIKTFLNRHRGTETAVNKITGKAKVAATESNADDRARYDAADDKNKKKVTLPKAPWDKKDEGVNETTGSAVKKPVNVTGPDGKTRTVMRTTKSNQTDDRGNDKIKTKEEELSAKQKKIDHNKNGKIDGHDLAMLRKKKQNESVEQLDEMKFKRGPLRLKNGKQVMVSKQDADLLTQMFKDLSATNRRKMQGVAMTDEAGFKEILGFAREAL